MVVLVLFRELVSAKGRGGDGGELRPKREEVMEEIRFMYPEVDMEILKRYYGVGCGD